MSEQIVEDIFYSSRGDVMAGTEKYEAYHASNLEDQLTALADIWSGDAPLPPTSARSFKRLDKTTYVNIGRRVAQLIAPEPLTGAVFDRGHRIGVTFSSKQIQRRFVSIPNFLDEVGERGIHRPGVFEQWTISEYVSDIRQLGEELGRRPSQGILRKRAHETKGTKEPKPSPRIIRKKIDMRQLYELAGYPHIQQFSPEDYVLWGVLFRMANGPEPSMTNSLRYLSPRGRSPSTRSIGNYFGNISEYDRLVAAKLDELGQTVPNNPPNANEARLALLDELMPSAAKDTRRLVAETSGVYEFAIAAWEADHNLTPWRLQKQSLLDGTFMEIWGDDYLNNLKVPVVKKSAKRERINGAVVLSTTVMPNGMVIKKLSPEAMKDASHSKRGNLKPAHAEVDSYRAKQAVARVREELEPQAWHSMTIHGTKGLRRKKSRTYEPDTEKNLHLDQEGLI